MLVLKGKKSNVTMLIVVVIIFSAVGIYLFLNSAGGSSSKVQPLPKASGTVSINFPSDRYPETAEHIKEAIQAGEPAVCTIDREDADEHRKESLKGIPTKTGYDRDEWPMAMCAEGGTGANIEYIKPKDNRGAGSWVGNKLEDYPDGTRVTFVVK